MLSEANTEAPQIGLDQITQERGFKLEISAS